MSTYIETIGSDPEFAAINTETGEFTSIIGLFGGTKEEPLSIGEGCFRQEDNVNAEFCIPPVTTKEDWLKHLNHCVTVGNSLLPENLELIAVSSARFDESQLRGPGAKEFGCNESFSAYTHSVVKVPPANKVGNLRTCGFHVHTGFQTEVVQEISDIETFIKIMDLYLGVPSIILDLDQERRNIYGAAGDYRYRLIGDDIVVIEYRSLGGNLLGSELTRGWVYDNTRKAIEVFKSGKYQDILDVSNSFKTCIETQNVGMAKELCEKFDVDFPNIKIMNESVVFEDAVNYV